MPSFRDEFREAVSGAGPLGSGEYSALEGPRAQKLARSLLLALQAPQNSLRWRLAVWRLSRKSWLIDTESFDIEPIQALCLHIVRQRKGDPRLANLSRRLVCKGQSPVPKLLLTTIAQATANTSGTVMIEFGDPIRIHYDEGGARLSSSSPLGGMPTCGNDRI